jgi:ABC-2 type transport system ATP-binding protein
MALNDQLAIDVSGMAFRYAGNEHDSFSDFNLQITKGKRFGLLGPNGAGKTTLMSLLSGLIKADKGSIRLLGHDVSHKNKNVNKLFGFVPQDLSFYNELSPVENLAFFGAWAGLNKHEISERTDELLTILGLQEVRNKEVQKFSGGMKRRVNLAIGVIHRPQVLFLDEPTVGVDVHTRNAILDYLLTLNKTGTTLIYTSHQLTEAEDLCEQIAVLDKGKLVIQGETDTLLKDHKNEDLETFFLNVTGKEYRD